MNNEVRDIEVSIEELNAKIALLDALEKLEKNAAFKTLFLKEYFEKRPQELSRVASQVTLDERSEKVWMNSQIAVSGLQQFLFGIRREGTQAREDLAEYQATLDEVRG